MLADAAVLVCLAYWLQRWHSRLAATLLLLLILAGMLATTTLMNVFGVSNLGGRNLFLALIGGGSRGSRDVCAAEVHARAFEARRRMNRSLSAAAGKADDSTMTMKAMADRRLTW